MSSKRGDMQLIQAISGHERPSHEVVANLNSTDLKSLEVLAAEIGISVGELGSKLLSQGIEDLIPAMPGILRNPDRYREFERSLIDAVGYFQFLKLYPILDFQTATNLATHGEVIGEDGRSRFGDWNYTMGELKIMHPGTTDAIVRFPQNLKPRSDADASWTVWRGRRVQLMYLEAIEGDSFLECIASSQMLSVNGQFFRKNTVEGSSPSRKYIDGIEGFANTAAEAISKSEYMRVDDPDSLSPSILIFPSAFNHAERDGEEWVVGKNRIKFFNATEIIMGIGE
ncbi:hypothetical protein [Halioglobus sp. HI00S01]|uniref:hypothetical protein n=1 Tax=Halioglobus sp. HI00S01 TaxID=1822214 RepID=UPI0012E71820|nr:hypothetical protein [Halioglobus sp. HI00S01]